MKLLIDVNILLDVLQARKPHLKESSLIWKLCETHQTDGFVPALSFANLVYIMRKEMDPEQVEKTLDSISLIFEIADLQSSDLKKAAGLHWSDFEDAVQSVTASRIGADYIITRNTKDFSQSAVPAVSPKQFLELLS